MFFPIVAQFNVVGIVSCTVVVFKVHNNFCFWLLCKVQITAYTLGRNARIGKMITMSRVGNSKSQVELVSVKFVFRLQSTLDFNYK